MSVNVESDEIIQGDQIFLVDDDPTVVELLSSLFQSEGYRVTAFSDGDSFAIAAKSRRAACLLMDICMPGRSGLEILKEICTSHYDAPIIVMSGHATIEMAVEAIKGGAFDIIEKPFDPETIVTRIRQLIAAWRLQRERDNVARAEEMEFPGVERLTQRERQVLAEIAAAASNKEAGRHLGLSPRTIEVHRAHIMSKLGTKNTADLVRLALNKRVMN